MNPKEQAPDRVFLGVCAKKQREAGCIRPPARVSSRCRPARRAARCQNTSACRSTGDKPVTRQGETNR